MSADPVVIVPHDPTWPAQFLALQRRIVGALGPLALAIEHVGSTAVPGLAAKPVIDLDVIVRSPADIPAAIDALATLGYTAQGEKGVPGREAFRWPAGEARHHVYVCPQGTHALEDHLLFRDYLRAHPEVAQEYGRLKQAYAAQHGSNRDAYSVAKAAFIDRVTEIARRERQKS